MQGRGKRNWTIKTEMKNTVRQIRLVARPVKTLQDRLNKEGKKTTMFVPNIERDP